MCFNHVFNRHVSVVCFTCVFQEVEQLFQSYLRRFSELAGAMINCGSILNWLEVRLKRGSVCNHGNSGKKEEGIFSLFFFTPIQP